MTDTKNKSNKIISFFLILASMLFPAILLIAVPFRQYLPFFGLSLKDCYIASMQLTSLILLLHFFQKPLLSVPWRVLCLAGSFLILIETLMM